MEFLEKDLEQIIWESDKKKLDQRGLSITGKLKRQLRIGNYGIADLVEVNKFNSPPFKDTYLNFTVYELKKDKIGISAFLQALNYCAGIKEYMQIHKPKMQFDFNIILVGKSLDTSGSFSYIPDLFNNQTDYPDGTIKNVAFYTYEYGVDGLNFSSHCGYVLTNKGF